MYRYKAKQFISNWWVVTEKEEIKITKIASWIRYPEAVATTIADSLNRNKKFTLIDLV